MNEKDKKMIRKNFLLKDFIKTGKVTNAISGKGVCKHILSVPYNNNELSYI